MLPDHELSALSCGPWLFVSKIATLYTTCDLSILKGGIEPGRQTKTGIRNHNFNGTITAVGDAISSVFITFRYLNGGTVPAPIWVHVLWWWMNQQRGCANESKEHMRKWGDEDQPQVGISQSETSPQNGPFFHYLIHHILRYSKATLAELYNSH